MYNNLFLIMSSECIHNCVSTSIWLHCKISILVLPLHPHRLHNEIILYFKREIENIFFLFTWTRNLDDVFFYSCYKIEGKGHRWDFKPLKAACLKDLRNGPLPAAPHACPSTLCLRYTTVQPLRATAYQTSSFLGYSPLLIHWRLSHSHFSTHFC